MLEGGEEVEGRAAREGFGELLRRVKLGNVDEGVIFMERKY